MLTNPISLFSQCLFALPLTEAIRATSDLGFEAIELACIAPHFDEQAARQSPETVAESIQLQGLKVSALSLFSSFTDPDQLKEQIAAASHYIRLAPLFETEIVKITPGQPAAVHANEYHWDSFKQALDCLIPLAEDMGVRLACETHMRQLTDTLAGTLRMLDSVSGETLGLTVDFSNMSFAGESMVDVFDRLSCRMYNTHVKNGTVGEDGSWHFEALDTGWTDYDEVMGLVKGSGYTGYLTVECLGTDARDRPLQTATRDLVSLNEFMGRY
ncbi:MAG: sugar phosphate isomerase/epimerase [Candidatus Latescibacteria bacterium]|nr:sugar phosphate isomerase/epimerase [Candidatus Latescibacterota bacterium]